MRPKRFIDAGIYKKRSIERCNALMDRRSKVKLKYS